jgi:hypothetical protein
MKEEGMKQDGDEERKKESRKGRRERFQTGNTGTQKQIITPGC